LSGRQLRGWIDYERQFLPALAPAERIDYFEKRVGLVAINPLCRILRTEIIVSGEESSALLIFGLSICCAIEAAGKFLTGGKGGNAARFHAFVNGYMSSDFAAKTFGGRTYGEALWDHFRNGLAHGFAVCHGGFEGNPGQDYFAVRTIAGVQALEINPTSLFEDFAGGFEKYLQDLRAAGPADQLFVAFNHVFEQVFIRGN
jgi:hypothetical protein